MKLAEFKKSIYKKCDGKISCKDKMIADIASQVFEARLKRGMTQKELASLIGTEQPSIARLEAGNFLPSLDFLRKIAEALNTELIPPKFAFINKIAIAGLTCYDMSNLHEFISTESDISLDNKTDYNNKTLNQVETYKY